MSATTYFTPDVPIPLRKGFLEIGLRDQFGAVWGMATNPIKSLSAYQFELPVFQYRLFGSHFTVVNDPDMIRYCFVENAKNYELEPIRQSILRPILRDGLVSSDGDIWKRARQSMAPIFTPRYIATLAEQMKIAVAKRLDDVFDINGGEPIADKMSDLAYGVLSEVLFSRELDEDATQTMETVSKFIERLGNVDPFDLLQLPSWIPRPTRLRGYKELGELREQISMLISNRISKREAGQDLPDDLLTRLICVQNKDGSSKLNSDEIEDHMLTFIIAGHESTARSLSWILYLLSGDNIARSKVEEEIDNIDLSSPAKDWAEQLTFTSACYNEALRLFPPLPFVTRMAREDDRYKLSFIPKGGYLFLNLYALHRHKLLWDRPDSFMPERFLGDKKAARHKFQFLPFGVGHRICIGGHFAMQEALIILVMILKKYRFEYAVEKPATPVMRISLKPNNGMPMRVTRR